MSIFCLILGSNFGDIGGSIGGSVGGSMIGSAGGSIGGSVGGSIGGSVGGSMIGSAGGSMIGSMSPCACFSFINFGKSKSKIEGFSVSWFFSVVSIKLTFIGIFSSSSDLFSSLFNSKSSKFNSGKSKSLKSLISLIYNNIIFLCYKINRAFNELNFYIIING